MLAPITHRVVSWGWVDHHRPTHALPDSAGCHHTTGHRHRSYTTL